MTTGPYLELTLEVRTSWYLRPAMRLLVFAANLVNRGARLRVCGGPWRPIPLVQVTPIEYPDPGPYREHEHTFVPPPLEKLHEN